MKNLKLLTLGLMLSTASSIFALSEGSVVQCTIEVSSMNKVGDLIDSVVPPQNTPVVPQMTVYLGPTESVKFYSGESNVYDKLGNRWNLTLVVDELAKNLATSATIKLTVFKKNGGGGGSAETRFNRTSTTPGFLMGSLSGDLSYRLWCLDKK